MFLKSNAFRKFVHITHINKNVNTYVWDDVLNEKGTWVRVFLKDGTSYIGQHIHSECFEREPIIALACYQKLDVEGKAVKSYVDEPNEIVVMNTKDFDRIEITKPKKEE